MNRKWLISFIPLIVSSCAIQPLPVDETGLIEKPKSKYTNLSDALQCAKEKISSSEDREFGYLFAIAHITDGTLSNMMAHDSPLSDRMHTEFATNLFNSTRGYGVILANFPQMYLAGNMNSSGEANKGRHLEMVRRQLGEINTIRRAAIAYNQRNNIDEKISLYRDLKPVVVTGTFTRSDDTPIKRKNTGFGFGNSGTDTGDSQIGKTAGYKALSLNMVLSNPITNQMIASKTFTIFTHEVDNSFNLNLGVGEGFLSFTNENILVESKHGAQQTLIDAASLWALDKTYGSVANIGGCLK